MLTFIESISLAGDRAKQNDDACGFTGPRAWVIDGATDLSDAPLTLDASDASWLARFLSTRLHGPVGNRIDDVVKDAAFAFGKLVEGKSYERWQSPIASLLMVWDRGPGVAGVDLGDCRLFALDADGHAHVIGGLADAADAEARLAAQQTDAHKPLMQRTATLEKLRAGRAALNREGGAWTFCLDPACADHARYWQLQLARPTHLLLMTDGFSALADRYRAYDPAGLVQAALDKGLQELGRELRAIEAEDAEAARHPRFKPSDDATALLMRLS